MLEPDAPPSPESADVTDLLLPADGVPELLSTPAALRAAAAAIESGTGPIALDAERASGYRYSARAYLVQLRRAGSGSFLVDPIPLVGSTAVLGRALSGPEWVLHAAKQDLACLAELGLVPAALFDTELAGRLLGYERVGLAAMAEKVLGLGLRKGHGAADWSSRPLPPEWLIYAALDVEVLLELRAALVTELAEQGKTEWARQEFEHVRLASAPAPKPDRWRRTSGIHALRRPRQLAAVRELWLARDTVAAARDIAAGRVLPDAAIADAAAKDPIDLGALTALPVFGGRMQRKQAHLWFAALQRARELPESSLPAAVAAFDGPPPVSRWSERDPQAHARLLATRSALAALSATYRVPVENLLLPDLARRLCWSPPERIDDDAVEHVLLDGGARRWQRELVGPALVQALRAGSGPVPAA